MGLCQVVVIVLVITESEPAGIDPAPIMLEYHAKGSNLGTQDGEAVEEVTSASPPAASELATPAGG